MHSVALETTAGATSGKVMVTVVRQRPAPSMRAACSWLASILPSAAATAKNTMGNRWAVSMKTSPPKLKMLNGGPARASQDTKSLLR
jgi:hypothetical protein